MIRACPACGKKNRVPASRLADDGVCGACKQALPAVSAPLDVDVTDFDEIVAGARVPVLVDFWATWCPPCRASAPHVAAVAQQMKGKALVLKVDTDRDGALAARFGVRGIPHFVVLKDGRPVVEQAGAVDARTLQSYLARAGV